MSMVLPGGQQSWFPRETVPCLPALMTALEHHHGSPQSCLLSSPQRKVLGWGLSWALTDALFTQQQRGERDSQTQAILTKLKCAAGEGVPQPLGCPGLLPVPLDRSRVGTSGSTRCPH